MAGHTYVNIRGVLGVQDIQDITFSTKRRGLISPIRREQYLFFLYT